MIRLFKRLGMFSGGVCLLFAFSYAQEVTITGKVVNQYGIPVSGAEVTLKKLRLSCITNNDGIFNLDGRTAGIMNTEIRSDIGSVEITPKYLELGSCFNATITIFSIRGSVLNKAIVKKQNRIALDKLFPTGAKNQATIISVAGNGWTKNIRSVKCGNIWLFDNRPIIDNSREMMMLKAVSNAPDTIIVRKDSMQTVAQPLPGLIATLPDIMLPYIVNPGDPNDRCSGSLLGDVLFSEPSRTFKTPLSVTLSTAITGAEIRYTIDGFLPTSSSTLYNGAIAINQTTQIRAAAFVTGTPSGCPSTVIYIARNFDYTSDIPIIILEGYGEGKPEDKYNFIDIGFMCFEPVNGTASLDNQPTIATRAGYHLRGQSSMMMFKQAPYRIELWDNDNNDARYPLCGMPEGADWALISPCTDNSLIRNVVGFELGKAIGLATVQYRFAEIFINQDGGILEASDYEGIYQVIQPIKNRKNTLDLKQLRNTDTDPKKLSGAYILKFDQAVNDSGMIKLECVGAPKMTTVSFGYVDRDTEETCFADLELVDPPDPNQEQITWITGYIQQFHDALHAKPAGNWKDYIDVGSFVNIHILNEITCDVDSWIRSHFMYKERGKPLTAGPVWDYNFALGNFTGNHSGWHVDSNRIGSNDWNLLMWEQPEFKAAFKTRYNELRGTVLTDNAVLALVDEVKKPLDNIGQRNFTAWPMGTCSSGFWGRMAPEATTKNNGLAKAAGMSDFFKTEEITDSTWAGQVDSLKVWTTRRLKTLDSLTSTLP